MQTETQPSPAQVGSDQDWQAVAASEQSTCGLRADTLYCWGRSESDTLGVPGSQLGYMDQPSPLRVSAGWQAISMRGGRGCGLQAGALLCWGATWNASYDDYSTLQTPTRVGSEADWSAISLGDEHACGLRGGTLYCWGSDNGASRGVLGLGSTAISELPARVGDAADWAVVSAGVVHSCGIRLGALYCWGENDFGQLGTGDLSIRTSAAAVLEP